MKIYQLTIGILEAKISRFTEKNVILKFRFDLKEPIFVTLSKDNFNGLDSWVQENYDLAIKL